MEISSRQLHIWRFSNVVLRLPSVFILEAIHNLRRGRKIRGTVESLASGWELEPHAVTIGSQFLGYFVVFLLHALPLRMLIKLYKFIVVGLLLLAAHLLSDYSLSRETTVPQSSLVSAVTFTLAEVVISLTCARLMGTKHVWAFAAYTLPQIAKLSGLPLDVQESAHEVAQVLTLTEVTLFTLRHVLVPFRLALIGYKTLQEYSELYGIVSVIFALYNRFFVPMLYLIFWLVLFVHRLYVYYSTKDRRIVGEHWVLVIFAAIADCCESPWSLVGLCYTVSYTAFLVLFLCKLYLKGFSSLGGETFLHRGWTEGITVMLLAMETGLLELKKLERILLLSVLMYIALSSTIQSVYEILDPVLLALAASNNPSPWKHFRALSMCVALMAAPLYLSYMLFVVFEAQLWLMIIVSSCLLTTIQTLGSLTIYLLFMADHRRATPWESLDDLVYGIHAMCHVMEFGIALSVLFYGGMESFHSDYNLFGAAIILIHCYFNVFQRAQAGWQSFLTRRDAVRKINSLPSATKGELSSLRDVCVICFEEMTFAKVTPCKHYFHSVCLRRWLYVQDKCPLCHKSILPEMPQPPQGIEEPREELPWQPHPDLGQGDGMMAL
ncbi:RING finger protein 145-like [Patiria miniata]|uniref:RING-type domain-containing protein n=1 Tax=Patiria miniata TaxID=46514 RepID=A0A914B526_PATMI|nr:RING finger protein 145-like [Patiria miniata]